MQQNDSRLTVEDLQRQVAERQLAPARLLPVGQLRIATIPSQEAIAACRSRLPHLTVGQQRIAVLPTEPIRDELQVSPEQLAEWIRPRCLNPDGSVTVH